jgi:hypothetical protein
MQAIGAGGGPAGKSSSKVKIVLKTPASHAPGGRDDAIDDLSPNDENGGGSPIREFTPLTEEQGFTERELAMPLDRLHKLCRLQVRWAEADGVELAKECKRWEDEYKRQWLEKEVLLDQVVQAEQGWYARRTAVLSGAADVQVPVMITNGSSGVASEVERDHRASIEA